MKCNVGNKERMARIFVGVVAGAAAALSDVPDGARIGLGIVSGLGLFTGLLRYCPVNQLLGYNGCAIREDKVNPTLDRVA